jgi:hypothetical protein
VRRLRRGSLDGLRLRTGVLARTWRRETGGPRHA